MPEELTRDSELRPEETSKGKFDKIVPDNLLTPPGPSVVPTVEQNQQKSRREKPPKERNKIRAEESKLGKTLRWLIPTSIIFGIPSCIISVNFIKHLIDEAQKGDLSPEEAAQEIKEQIINSNIDKNLEAFVRVGVEGQQALNVPGLNQPENFDDNTFVLNWTAKYGSLRWEFAPYHDEQGNEVVNQQRIDKITQQLNLNTEGKTYLEDHYLELWYDPVLAHKFFENYLPANSPILRFDQFAIITYNTDSDKNTWDDRYELLKGWEPVEIQALQSQIKTKNLETWARNDNKFNELVGIVDMETERAMGQMLGPLETLANMPIDTTAMHEAAAADMAEFYQHESQKPLLANTGLPLVLTGLFLLRVGPAWPREVIAKASKRLGNIYYWFKLGQPERVMRDLMVLGKQAWERVAGKKD